MSAHSEVSTQLQSIGAQEASKRKSRFMYLTGCRDWVVGYLTLLKTMHGLAAALGEEEPALPLSDCHVDLHGSRTNRASMWLRRMFLFLCWRPFRIYRKSLAAEKPGQL